MLPLYQMPGLDPWNQKPCLGPGGSLGASWCLSVVTISFFFFFKFKGNIHAKCKHKSRVELIGFVFFTEGWRWGTTVGYEEVV